MQKTMAGRGEEEKLGAESEKRQHGHVRQRRETTERNGAPKWEKIELHEMGR